MTKLFIVGHPGLHGGAATELHHQIRLWAKAFPEIELNIIPTQQGFVNEPLYNEMISLGCVYNNALDFSAITKDDAVINFCSDAFLTNLDKIKEKTNKIAFVNCMTFIFDKERAKAKHNYISHYLYQRPQVLEDHKRQLEEAGAKSNFLHFIPYYDESSLEFNISDTHKTTIGRISRPDADKFSKDTLHIYEYIVSPKMKVGKFLGFNDLSRQKIGEPFGWIDVYRNQTELSVKRFYSIVDFIVQPTDTTENLPRIGFEAMHSGVPLVVDNRGGWKYMIEHKKSGFLCNSPRDFIYWGSRLAYEKNLKEDIAHAAKERAKVLSSFEQSKESWKNIFENLYATV